MVAVGRGIACARTSLQIMLPTSSSFHDTCTCNQVSSQPLCPSQFPLCSFPIPSVFLPNSLCVPPQQAAARAALGLAGTTVHGRAIRVERCKATPRSVNASAARVRVTAKGDSTLKKQGTCCVVPMRVVSQ